MSILKQAAKPQDNAPIITILGDAGLGKTSLAASFPKPIFICAEEGLQSVPENVRPDALPTVKTATDLWQQVKALMSEEHDYKTLVIDSVTALDKIFMQDVLESDPSTPASINQALGGYGSGIAAVTALHNRLRKGVGLLVSKKKMTIVFIAHADTENIELPDQESGYTRFCLRLNKKSVSPYVDDVDLVGFIKLCTFVKTRANSKTKRGIATGERELVCHVVAENVSKNRYGITESVLVEQGKNPLLDLIPFFNNKTGVK